MLKVLRGSDTLSIPIALGSGKVLGVYPKVINDFEYAVKEYSFFGAIPAGINMGFDWIKSYLKQFKLFKNPEAFRSVGGFISIGQHIPQRVGLAGFLGINGHVVYYSWA